MSLQARIYYYGSTFRTLGPLDFGHIAAVIIDTEILKFNPQEPSLNTEQSCSQHYLIAVNSFNKLHLVSRDSNTPACRFIDWTPFNCESPLKNTETRLSAYNSTCKSLIKTFKKQGGVPTIIDLPVIEQDDYVAAMKSFDNWKKNNSTYNVLKNNCAHYVLNVLLRCGYLSKLPDCFIRPCSAANYIRKCVLKKLEIERKKLLSPHSEYNIRYINCNKKKMPVPLLEPKERMTTQTKIKYLIENDLCRLKLELAHQVASYIHLNIIKIKKEIEILQSLLMPKDEPLIFRIQHAIQDTDGQTQAGLRQCACEYHQYGITGADGETQAGLREYANEYQHPVIQSPFLHNLRAV